MKGMTIRAMTQACHGIYHGDEGAVDIEISAITTDSRKIQKNGMFIAICGEKSDGHDYIGKCFDDGALCCISERELPGESRPYIQVESSLTALKTDSSLILKLSESQEVSEKQVQKKQLHLFLHRNIK